MFTNQYYKDRGLALANKKEALFYLKSYSVVVCCLSIIITDWVVLWLATMMVTDGGNTHPRTDNHRTAQLRWLLALCQRLAPASGELRLAAWSPPEPPEHTSSASVPALMTWLACHTQLCYIKPLILYNHIFTLGNLNTLLCPPWSHLKGGVRWQEQV